MYVDGVSIHQSLSLWLLFRQMMTTLPEGQSHHQKKSGRSRSSLICRAEHPATEQMYSHVAPIVLEIVRISVFYQTSSMSDFGFETLSSRPSHIIAVAYRVDYTVSRFDGMNDDTMLR